MHVCIHTIKKLFRNVCVNSLVDVEYVHTHAHVAVFVLKYNYVDTMCMLRTDYQPSQL